MTKHKVAYAISALAVAAGVGVLGSAGAWADTVVVESCEAIESKSCAVVTNTAELSEAFTNKIEDIIIGGSFDLTADLRTAADMTIYLNDSTITSDGWSIINTGGNNLTIYAGESGKIVETGGQYAPLYVYGNTTLKSGTIEAAYFAVSAYYDTGNFIMDGGTVRGTGYAILVNNGANFTLNDGVAVADGKYQVVSVDAATFTMNGGAVTATGEENYGITTWNDATFTMNGGVVTAKSVALGGNGTTDEASPNYGANTVWNLNAGTLSSESSAVYHPQKNGVVAIKDGMTIYGVKNGLEIRAGTLNIEGGSISVSEETAYDYAANGSGTTSTGTAVTVAQHTTKLPITVNITGGTFTAPVAFNEINPQQNSAEDLSQIQISITGGTFIANDGINYAVHSEDFKGFIAGGKYSLEPDMKYLADGDVVNAVADYYVVAEAPSASDDASKDAAESASNENVMTKETNEAIAAMGAGYANLMDGGSITLASGGKVTVVNAEALKTALMEGHAITASLRDNGDVSGSISVDEYNALHALVLSGANTLGIFDFSVGLYDEDGALLANLTELSGALIMSYDVSGVPAVASGYNRTWQVIRYHDGMASEIASQYNATTGVLGFESELFSSYLIAYTDTPATPETGTVTREGASAMGATLMTAIAVGVITSIVSFAVLIRRR